MKALILLIAVFALLAGCSSTSKSWESELVIVEERTGPPATMVSAKAGWIEVEISESIRETRTPSERLVLLHTIRDSWIPWEDIGQIALIVVATTVAGVLYLGAWAALWWGLLALDARY